MRLPSVRCCLIPCRREVPDFVDLGDHLLTEHQALLARAREVLAEQAKAEPSTKPVVAVVASKPVAATAVKPAARVAAKGAVKIKAKAKSEPQLKLVGTKAAAPKPRKALAAKRAAVRAVR